MSPTEEPESHRNTCPNLEEGRVQWPVSPVAAGYKERERCLLLPTLSADSNSLAVRRPGNVLDATADGLVLILQDVLFLSGVPDADLSRCICIPSQVQY